MGIEYKHFFMMSKSRLKGKMIKEKTKMLSVKRVEENG